MTSRLYIIVGLIFMSCRTGIPQDQLADRPNIVYILADDMGYGDLSVLNHDSKIRTPHMDQIARNGVYFTDAHSNSSVCTPTRYGILTGRYAFRSRLKSGVLNGYSSQLIEPGRLTVASFLKENGYHTACIGKWHLGLNWQPLDHTKSIKNLSAKEAKEFGDNVDYHAEVLGGPAEVGFDYSFIIPASLDMPPYCYIRDSHVVSPPDRITEGRGERDGRGTMRRSGMMAADFDFEGVLPSLVDDAIRYINLQDERKPFFLYLPLPSPHTPWVPTQAFENTSEAGLYGDYVAETDFMIGRIVDALKDNGLLDNTLLIVTSDNGSDWKPEDIDRTGHLANVNRKGRKADIYEAGHRIPFIAQWPKRIPMGSMSDQLLCTTDLIATIAGIFGQQLPAGAGEDSYNMLPAFVGKAQNESMRAAIIHHSLRGFFAIRKGPWKMATSLGSGGFTQPREIESEGKKGTLYQLEQDPEERNDVYDQYPDVVAELTELLNQYIEGGRSTGKD